MIVKEYAIASCSLEHVFLRSDPGEPCPICRNQELVAELDRCLKDAFREGREADVKRLTLFLLPLSTNVDSHSPAPEVVHHRDGVSGSGRITSLGQEKGRG